MKTILRYFAVVAVVILALASCKKNKEDKGVSVAGEWKLETFGGASTASQEVDVYVIFTADKEFTIYQKLGKGHYSKFAGTYTVAGSVLNGTYSDGTPWASSYEATVADGTLTLKAKDADSHEESVYVSETVPASVKQDADTYATKATGECPWL